MNGDGGSRTHVQRHRHLSIYERSRYILLRRSFRLPTGLPTASLVRLFPRPQAADLGVARFIWTPRTPHGRWREELAAAIRQLKRSFLCQLSLGDVFTRTSPSARRLSSTYPCRIRIVPAVAKKDRSLSMNHWLSYSYYIMA